MAAEPEVAEAMTYTRYVTDLGHAGDPLGLTVALMPYVAGYPEVGQRDPGRSGARPSTAIPTSPGC